MPGNVFLGQAFGVFPKNLCSAFSRQKHWDMRIAYFPDGSHIRGAIGTTEQNAWSLSQRLVPSSMASLRAFYLGHNGPQIPFYFYDFIENHFQYDGSGTLTLGRYLVCFSSGLDVTGDIARSNASFGLVQIA